jgi:hypothetical protein
LVNCDPPPPLTPNVVNVAFWLSDVILNIATEVSVPLADLTYK